MFNLLFSYPTQPVHEPYEPLPEGDAAEYSVAEFKSFQFHWVVFCFSAFSRLISPCNEDRISDSPSEVPTCTHRPVHPSSYVS